MKRNSAKATMAKFKVREAKSRLDLYLWSNDAVYTEIRDYLKFRLFFRDVLANNDIGLRLSLWEKKKKEHL